MLRDFTPDKIQEIKSNLFARFDKGSMPGSMIINKEKDELYVFEYGGKKITVMELPGGKITSQIPLDASPAYCIEKDKNLFFITLDEPAGVILFVAGENRVSASLPLEGDKVVDCCYSEKHTLLFLTLYDSSDLFIINENLSIEKKLTLPGKPGRLLLDDKNGRLYISIETSKCEITILDLDSLEIQQTITREDPGFLWNKMYKHFNTLALSPDGKWLVVGCHGMNETLSESPLFLIDTENDEVKKRITSMGLRRPSSIHFNPYADEVYVICEGTIYVIDTIEFEMRNSVHLGGEISVCTITEKGTRILATDLYDNAFYMLDLKKNNIARANLGKLPIKMVIDEKRNRALVSCFLSDELMAINLNSF